MFEKHHFYVSTHQLVFTGFVDHLACDHLSIVVLRGRNGIWHFGRSSRCIDGRDRRPIWYDDGFDRPTLQNPVWVGTFRLGILLVTRVLYQPRGTAGLDGRPEPKVISIALHRL